jgi:hypothetical protein
MEKGTRRFDECFLGDERLGRASVYHEHDTIWIAGSGERVGLRYQEAVHLYQWLRQHHVFLLDRAHHFYECRECGAMHPRDVQACPMLSQADDF